ncbi:RHS repeat-associated core domain-containing protein, partial [uncultured Clostridium sp.]
MKIRARNYNPSTGRFISRDSFTGRRSDPLSLNLYTYCGNNPVIFTDPFG